MTVVSYLNRQGGLHSRPLYRLARCVLWAHTKFLSIRAVHVPGHLNSVEDSLSRQSLEDGEWRLHSQVVNLVWQRFSRAEVDLFTSSTTTHCPLWFSLSPLSPLVMDAQRIPNRIVETISLAYEACGFTSPLGLRAHSTGAVASS